MDDVAASEPDRAWLTHNVRVLSGVSFLQDAASELLYPVLPIFRTVTLGAPAAVVGVAEGVAEGAASIVKLYSGLLGDLYAKRPLIGLGYGLAAVGKLLIAVAVAFGWPLVLFAHALGKGSATRSSSKESARVKRTGVRVPSQRRPSAQSSDR